MLRVCLPQQYGSPVYHTNTKLDTTCIFSRSGLSQQVNSWPCYESICIKCFSQGRNDALPSLGTKPSVDNFAVANLRSYMLVQ